MKILALTCLTLLGLGATQASAQYASPRAGKPLPNYSKPVVLHPQSWPQKPGYGFQGGNPNLQVSFGHGGAAVQLTLGHHRPYQPPAVWVPGCWVSERQQVWVPGTCIQVWQAPIYQTAYNPCGQPYQVLVQAGHYQTVQQPGHFEVQLTQVWREGYWRPGC